MTGVLQMLFIIAIIAVVVLVFVVFIWQQAGRHIKKYLQGRLSKWLLIGYVTVLIVSIGLSFMIPVDQASGDKRDEADFYRSQDELYQLITAGSIEEIDPAYIEGRWEKDMALDQLQTVHVVNRSGLHIQYVQQN